MSRPAITSMIMYGDSGLDLAIVLAIYYINTAYQVMFLSRKNLASQDLVQLELGIEVVFVFNEVEVEVEVSSMSISKEYFIPILYHGIALQPIACGH
ncbi:MAG: hypothetical protein WA364_25520 [Candidatus Nitrosopolaris sp.]